MKSPINNQSQFKFRLPAICTSLLILLVCLLSGNVISQDEAVPLPTNKPVKATFESTLLIDNQTIMVPAKGSFQFDIQHRFGVMKNGWRDLYGLYAPSNIRM